MAKRRVILKNRRQRSILTDMLPFEVPPTFSNRGFFCFLRDNNVQFSGGNLQWTIDSVGLETAISLLFGVKTSAIKTDEVVTEWGSTKTRRSVSIGSCRMDTIPFNFTVAHKLDGRILSVVHPRNQVQVASFYSDHSALIIYYTSRSEFSIRRPVSVSRYAYFKDKLHEQKLEKIPSGIEQYDREYEQLGSYFVYRRYSNIHGFFESYKYHRCEKKYDAMMQIDVSKCFDSIYTHSLPWAILGKTQTKFQLERSKSTFGGRFDSLMQHLNHKETNGIVIGPEFSRVFAEIILQSIDIELEEKLKMTGILHKVNYEIFRYVDDYFVFYNDESTKAKFLEALQEVLKAKKLSINVQKLKEYKKPIITEITIAKERVSSFLNAEIDPRIEDIEQDDGSEPTKRLVCSINSNRIITLYKATIKESQVEYGDLLNYTFAIAENKIDKLQKCFRSCAGDDRDRRRVTYAFAAILEFAFFAYSASPKVNHTIRICRMIATIVDFLNAKGFSHELKHLVYKYVHDNVIQLLDKNTMSAHREVENLYLLIALSAIGRDYWLPEATLARHFLIDRDAAGVYARTEFLSHFSITVLLTYMKSKVRYEKLRTFIEELAVRKLKFVKAHCPNDSEALMLFLDLIVCPYVTSSCKQQCADVFGLDSTALTELQAVNEQWFTAWGDKFKLGKELDAKRSREVY